MHEIIEFDDSQAATYKRTGETLVVTSDCRVVFHKEWGEQTIQPGDKVMVPLQKDGLPQGEVYGCGAEEFAETYESTDRPLVYRKRATVRAYQVPVEFQVRTVRADGTVETDENRQPAGSWVIKNPGGEVYTNSDDYFCAHYVKVE